jgi:hypothetical protein
MNTITTTTEASTAVATAAASMFRKVLVHVDYSAESRNALRTALELHRSMRSEVCVLVHTFFDSNDEFLAGIGSQETVHDLVQEAQARARGFVETVVPGLVDEITVRALVETDLVRAVTRAAATWGATLVVLTGGAQSLFRNAEERLSRDLDVPVLVLKRPRDRAA